MSLRSGAQLGPYHVLGPLGSGGMGEVYRARDTKLNREVALKVLPERVGQDRDRMARFAREAQLLASLNHPNIAAIYGVEEAGGGLALVLEYVDGETLAERINRGAIPIREALRIAFQIAQALETAHEKAVIHRDLKPANVKITSEGTVKVLDFGLAKALQDEPASLPGLSQSPTLAIAATGAGIILGTPGYIAPEQALGKPVDRRADIWAFGVVLFEMLSGGRVFDGDTVTDTMAKVLEREPDWNRLPPRTPAALRKLLQRCLTKSSRDRLQAIGDARTLLVTVLRYTTITPDWKRAQVWVKSLKNGERKLLIENALDARFAGNGTLIFARQAKLFAVRFDLATLSVSGAPVQVLDGVTQALYGNAAVTWTGAAQFSVADNGTLIYAPGSIEPPLLSFLGWADRGGNVSPITGTRPMFRFAARVLPDGKRIGFSELHLNKDIWIFDPTRGTGDRATYEGQNAFPIWSPDGSRMAFRSDRSGPLGIYMTKGTNLRDVIQLTPGPLDVPSSWTPDGKELVFTRGFSATGGNTDIYVVSVDQPKDVRALVATSATESFPEFSPDGKWLAYCSNESGQSTLYVQPYPGPGTRVTITGEGSPAEPAWSKNSNELFYRSGQRIFSVRFKMSGTDFIPEKPIMLFQQLSLGSGTTVRATYDVAPDGRFLLNLPIAETAEERIRKIFPSTLRLILNWTDETQWLLASQ